MGLQSRRCDRVGILRLGQHSIPVSGPEPFESIGVSHRSVIATYLGIGVASGSVIGMLKPLTLRRAGAYFVELLAGIPVAIGLVLCVSGLPRDWTTPDWIGIPIFTLAWGLLIGRQLDPKREATVEL